MIGSAEPDRLRPASRGRRRCKNYVMTKYKMEHHVQRGEPHAGVAEAGKPHAGVAEAACIKTPTGKPYKGKGQQAYNEQRRQRYAANEDVRDNNKQRCKARYERTKVLKRDRKRLDREAADSSSGDRKVGIPRSGSADTTTDKNHDE